MHWKNIKTVMIVLLLAVNLWLIYLLSVRYTAQTFLSRAELENTVQILGRDKIYLTMDQLDQRRREADVYAAELGEDYYARVAEIFTDSPIADRFPMPAGMRMLAESGESISIDTVFGVTYVYKGGEREEMAVRATQTAELGEAVSTGVFSLYGLRSNLEALLSKTVVIEGSVAPAHARLRVDAAYRKDGYTLIRCSQEIDGRKIRAHTVDCLFDSTGNLLYLDGTWSFLSLSANYSAQLYDQINILFMERAAVDALRDSAEEVLPLTVDSMSLCYILCFAYSDGSGEEDGSGGSVYYSPAWVIRYTDGSERVYNAVTGIPVSDSASVDRSPVFYGEDVA